MDTEKDITKSTKAPLNEKSSDPHTKTNVIKNEKQDISKLQGDYANLKSTLYKDSVTNKWKSDKEREKPPFLVRMINEDEDILSGYNSHKKLENLNSDNIQKTEMQFETSTKIKKKYCKHISLILTLIGSLIIILIEIIFLCLGIVFYNQCGYMNIYFITSAILHINIVIIEFIHKWIEKVKYHPKFRPCISIFQFLSSILIICLYIFCVIWYTIGFAWIMVPYTESISRVDKDEVIRIYYGTSERIMTQTFCSSRFFQAAIIYQIYVLCLFLFRIVLLGFGSFCKDICAKVSERYNTENALIAMYETYNEINENLPPISSWQTSNLKNQLFLPRTLHGTSFCMVANHPQWNRYLK